MKQFLLSTSVFLCFLLSIPCVSQTIYKVDERRVFSWDEAATPADWLQEVTELFSYENGGNKETLILGYLYPVGENLYKHIKTYNGNNDIKQQLMQFWDEDNSTYQDNVKIVYEYDGSNRLKSLTTQVYNYITMDFLNSSREVLDYTGSNNNRQTSQIWDGTDWENVEKIEITYTSGLPSSALTSLWDSTLMDWLAPYEQDTATYSNGMLDEVLTEDLISGELDRSTYMYTNNLLDTVLFEYSSDGGTNWEPYDQELFGYDANGNNNELIFEEYISESWVGYFKEERDYSVAGPLSIDPVESISFKVFPNPVSETLNILTHINIDRIELFDVQGKNILSSSDIKQVNISHLTSGIYFLKVFNNERNITKKIIIK